MKRKKFNPKKRVVENLPLNTDAESAKDSKNFSMNDLITIFQTENNDKSVIIIPAIDSSTGEEMLVDFNELAPIPNPEIKKISNSLRTRIRKVYDKIADVYQLNRNEFELGLRKEGHPEREVHVWEMIANTYQAFISNKAVSPYKRNQIFTVILYMSFGFPFNRLLDNAPSVTHDDLGVLIDLWNSYVC